MASNLTVIPISALRRGRTFNRAKFRATRQAIAASDGCVTGLMHHTFSEYAVYVEGPACQFSKIRDLVPRSTYARYRQTIKTALHDTSWPLLLFIENERIGNAPDIINSLELDSGLIVTVPTRRIEPTPFWDTYTREDQGGCVTVSELSLPKHQKHFIYQILSEAGYLELDQAENGIIQPLFDRNAARFRANLKARFRGIPDETVTLAFDILQRAQDWKILLEILLALEISRCDVIGELGYYDAEKKTLGGCVYGAWANIFGRGVPSIPIHAYLFPGVIEID